MKYFLIGMAFIIVIQTIPTYLEYKRNKRDEERKRKQLSEKSIEKAEFKNFEFKKPEKISYELDQDKFRSEKRKFIIVGNAGKKLIGDE